MTHTLKNSDITLSIADHGAEIKSLIRNSDGKELMWQADPKYWGRTSPVLFPVVGCYYNKESRFEGKTYSMGQHGFARDMEFELVTQTEDEILFKLADNEASHEKYPFAFNLFCGYKISGKDIQVIWKVVNTDNREIHFSIGAHPAFNCDLDADKLLFEKDGKALDSLHVNIIANDGSGCLSDKTKDLSLNDGVLDMSDELFSQDALVIEDEQADAVTILNNEGKAFIKVGFTSPLFGVWSPVGKHAPFVCIEPWYGRCDRVGFDGDISEREYGNTLKPGESFERSYNIHTL